MTSLTAMPPASALAVDPSAMPTPACRHARAQSSASSAACSAPAQSGELFFAALVVIAALLRLLGVAGDVAVAPVPAPPDGGALAVVVDARAPAG